MADVNRIRERLYELRHEAEKILDQRQSTPRTEPAAAPAAPDGHRERRQSLESELAEARLTADQARVRGDRLEAALNAAREGLRDTKAELEATRTRLAEVERLPRKSRRLRAEKRIAELEGELESERELRRDSQQAVELLQRRQEDRIARTAPEHEDVAVELEDDAPQPEYVAPEPEEPDVAPEPEDVAPQPEYVAPEPAEPDFAPEPENAAPEPGDVASEPERPLGSPEPDGWGKPLDAFPLDANAPAESLGSSRGGRRPRLRPGRRSPRP